MTTPHPTRPELRHVPGPGTLSERTAARSTQGVSDTIRYPGTDADTPERVAINVTQAFGRWGVPADTADTFGSIAHCLVSAAIGRCGPPHVAVTVSVRGIEAVVTVVALTEEPAPGASIDPGALDAVRADDRQLGSLRLPAGACLFAKSHLPPVATAAGT